MNEKVIVEFGKIRYEQFERNYREIAVESLASQAKENEQQVIIYSVEKINEDAKKIYDNLHIPSKPNLACPLYTISFPYEACTLKPHTIYTIHTGICANKITDSDIVIVPILSKYVANKRIRLFEYAYSAIDCGDEFVISIVNDGQEDFILPQNGPFASLMLVHIRCATELI